MRLHLLTLVSVLAAGSAAPLMAASFTPPATGSPLPATLTYTEGSTVTAYFYSSSADDTDKISVFDITTGQFLTPLNQLDNKTSLQTGVPITFSGASAGNEIAFDLYNSSYPSDTFSSDPTDSTDGLNHAYITGFDGVIGNPKEETIVGLYVGMEDLPKGASDWDYNDDDFVVTGVTAVAPTPEPSSIILFGTGLLGAAGVLRRKFAR